MRLSKNSGMEKRETMKKIIIFILSLLLPLLLTGCSMDMNRKEIDEIDLVRVLGIDYYNEEFILSALYNSSQGADPEGGSGESVVIEGRGRSVFEAYENIKQKNKKTISLAHTGYFLLGYNAAAKGIDKCLDFLSRDETIKMESLIFVMKYMDAMEFIKNGIENEQVLHEDLEAISQKQQEVIKRNDNNLVNILNEMEQSHSAVLIPYILSEEDSFSIAGYAVFKDYILTDYLDEDTSNGVRFLKNIIRRYPLLLSSEVGLLLTNINTKLSSSLDNKRITVMIEMDYESAIKEVTAEQDVFSYEMRNKLTEEQNQAILELISKPINYMMTTGNDIIGLARLIENDHVREWGSLKENWSELIFDIKYQYVIHSKIDKSFIMGNERGEK